MIGALHLKQAAGHSRPAWWNAAWQLATELAAANRLDLLADQVDRIGDAAFAREVALLIGGAGEWVASNE